MYLDSCNLVNSLRLSWEPCDYRKIPETLLYINPDKNTVITYMSRYSIYDKYEVDVLNKVSFVIV